MNITCRIVPRRSLEGHPFSEILYTWADGTRHALTRLFHPLDDTAFNRAHQIEAFKRRQSR